MVRRARVGTSPTARARRRRASAPPALLLVGGWIAALVALVPLAYLVVRTGEAGPARVLEILTRPRTLELIGRSVALTVIVTTGALLLGIAIALLVTRTDLPGRRVLAVLAGLPLAVPSYVAAFAWLTTAPWARGLLGASVVLTLVSFPYVYLPVAAALRRTDPAQEEVARSLGAGVLTTFARVTVPQIWPAAASGGLLVALYTLSDFGAVAMLQCDVFTRAIFMSYSASFDRTPAAVLACLLVLLTVVITLGERRTRRGDETARVGAGVSRDHAPAPLGAVGGAGLARWLWWSGCVGLLLLALGVPLYGILRWTRESVAAGIDVDRLVTSTLATAQYSFAGAAACTVLAIPVGILAARYRGPQVRAIESASWAGHALPGIVVALSLVFFGLRVVPGVYQEWPLLVFAYVVLFLPAAVGAVRAAVALSSPALEDVSRSLGHSALATWRRVTLPLAAPGIATGAALVTLTCAKELPATLMLHPTGVETLATSLWTHTSIAAYGGASPYAAMLVLLGLAPTVWLLHTSGVIGRSSAARPSLSKEADR